MKYFKLLPILFFLAFVVACDDDDDDDMSSNPTGGSPTGFFVSANVGGQAFNASTVIGELDSGFVAVSGLGGAFSNPFPVLSIGFEETATAPVTYTYDFAGLNSDTTSSVSYFQNDSTLYILLDGQLTLSQFDKTNKIVEGSFSGTMYEFTSLFVGPLDSLVVTNGRFRSAYN